MQTVETLAIVGAGGVVGAKLVERALAHSDGRVYAFTHGATPSIAAASSPRVVWQALDIGDAGAVVEALERARPQAVINTAAMTNVDACEARRDEAVSANAIGPANLARTCVRLDAMLLHVSTDYVFPGDVASPGPYLEGASTRAVNHYGQTKLEGERAVEDICTGKVPWLIARTALVYGYIPGGRSNFIRWLTDELRAGRRVRIVNDQCNTPTLADDLATALLHLFRHNAQGIIHLAGPDLIRRDEWARIIAQRYGLDGGLVDVVSTAELQQRAQRPLRSGLRSLRLNELAGVALRGVREGLDALAH